MRRRLAVFIFAAAAAALAAPLLAQPWRGPEDLEVRVEDAKGRDVEGAEVVLEYATRELGGPAPMLTDARGRLAIGGLLPGRWALEVRKPGFMSFRAEIALSGGDKPEIVIASQHNVPGATSTMRVRLGRARNAPPAPARVERVTAVAPPPAPAPPTAPADAPPAPTRAPASAAPPARAEPAEAPPAPVAAAEAPTTPPSAAPAAPAAATVPPPAPAPALPPPAAVESAPAPAEDVPATPAAAAAATERQPGPAPEPEPAPAQPAATAAPPPAPQPPRAPAAAPPGPPPPAAAPAPAASVSAAAPIARACYECRPGESALLAEATTAPQGGACPGDLASRLATVARGELAALTGGLPGGCAVLVIDLPANGKYVGFRYEAAGVGASADCLPGRECPAGACRFPIEPVVREEGGATRLLAIFESAEARRGGFTVYWRRTR